MRQHHSFSTAGQISHVAILRLLLTVLLVLAATSLFIKSAYGTETYAPIRKWAVDNWYQDKPQWHRRGFADAEASFKTDWADFETPCAPGQSSSWNYDSWFYQQNTGYQPESIAGATYIFKYCANSQLYGPYNYSSVSLRHWICADGAWHEPLQAGNPEICTLEEDKAEPDKNKGAPPCPDQCFGDPINAGTGNKFETRAEYRGPGEFPLEFSWTYNSMGSSPASDPYGDMVGFSRSTTFSRRVSVSASEGITTAYVSRPNGSSLRFDKQGSAWISSAGTPETLTSVGAPIQSWILEDASGSRDHFNADGRLLAMANAGGKRITIAYDSLGRIESATDESNRKLIFSYGPGSLLESLTLPEGSSLLFDYNAAGYLEKVTYPGGAFLSYLYDESGYVQLSAKGALTGVMDESGIRYSSTYYDATGKATATELGGVDLQSATYVEAAAGGYASSTSVTMSSGALREIEFQVEKGRVVPSSVSTTCSGCVGQSVAYAFDGNGYVDTVTQNGVVSDLDYDVRGLLTQKIEAANDTTGKKRTTQTDWHADFRVPTERRVYNAANTLVAKSTYTYNTRGQALTASQIDPATSVARTT
ncbi:DUF6531 domain-containing protein, partial [Pseudoxanthomonas sacheonensis]|uniref:DUF6531 domain-containing protein n=1 Tax=Pseudoxanthomonas sacheonensis TaxID=443615 RepID=UPI0013D706F9